MKRTLHFLLLVLAGIIIFNPMILSAQDNIEVTNTKAHMSKGSHTCYVVEIPMAILKDVQQNWVKTLQENNKVKVSQAGGEIILSNAVKPELYADTISIYSLFIEKEGKIVLHVFVEIDSVFFSPEEDKTLLHSDKLDNSIKNYMRNFAVGQYKLAAQEKLEAEQKKQKDLQSEYDKLVKEEENLTKDVSSLENEIEKTEREVSTLDQEIELKNQELTGHRTSMLSLVLDNEKKAAQEKDKSLEKDKNKLEKERQGLKNDISDMKQKIEKNNKAIEDSEKAQEEKLEEIEAQKTVVTDAQTFLDGIK